MPMKHSSAGSESAKTNAPKFAIGQGERKTDEADQAKGNPNERHTGCPISIIALDSERFSSNVTSQRPGITPTLFMISISQAANRFGLSRSTLIHYDRIGLLSPSYRTSAGYRLYESHDIERLDTICTLRRTGLSLEAIRQLLDESESGSIESGPMTAILTERLQQLQYSLAQIHAQQWATRKLLEQLGIRKDLPSFDKTQWIAFMESAGMSDQDKDMWHTLFEEQNPDGHQDFLEYLGIDPGEVRDIRAYYQKLLTEPPENQNYKTGPKKT